MNTEFLNHHYTLVLEQLNEVPLGELVGMKDLTYTPALIEIGELTFNYPKYITGDTGEKTVAPLYEVLESDTLLRIDGKEVYYINKCVEQDGDNGAEKQVHAYSRQYELSLKAINDYDPDGERFLYFLHPADSPQGFPWEVALPVEDKLAESILGTRDEAGAHYGIFNLVETLTSWRLKRGPGGMPEIPEAMQKEARIITTSEMNLLELMKTLQEAWNCVFHYDTEKREISIYNQSLFDNTPKGVLSDENFITSLSKELQTEEVKTRLFLYDERGAGILAERLAHGGTFVEDYDYFTKDKYMSTELQDALGEYFENLELLRPDTERIWVRLKALFNEQKEADKLIQDWERDLIDPLARYEHYVDLRDGFEIMGQTQEGVELQPYEEESMRVAAGEIEALNRKIQLYTSGNLPQKPRSLKQIGVFISAEKNSLKSLQNQGTMKAVFETYENKHGLQSGSLMKEMEPYVRDGTHQSESINNVDSLYNLGKDMLSYISKPRLAFSIDVVDFLDKINSSEFDYLATLGTVIEIQNSELEFSDKVILLKYSHSPETGSLTLEFSNQLSSRDETTFLAELIAKSNAVSSKVNFSSDFWGKGGSIGDSDVTSNSNFGSIHLQSKRLQTVGMDAMRVSTDTKFKIQDGLIETKVTEVQVSDLIETSAVNGRNLILAPELQPWGRPFEIDGYDIKLEAISSNNKIGVRLGNSLVEGNLDYVLSFRMKKNSGSITTIGSPTGLMKADTIKVWRDGILVSEGAFLDTYPNDTIEHEYEVHFTSKAIVVDWIYLQPNHSHYGLNYTATISELQLERGRKKSSWKPAMEDLGQKVIKNESSITQTAEQIELKVSKGDIASTINQTAQSVSISASKIDLSGYATFYSLERSGSTTINGDNITTGVIKSNNSKTKIDLDNGTIQIGSGSTNQLYFDGTNLSLGANLTSGTINIGSNAFQVDSIGTIKGGRGGFTVPWNADGVTNYFSNTDSSEPASRWKRDDGHYILQNTKAVRFYMGNKGVPSFVYTNEEGHYDMKIGLSGYGGATIRTLNNGDGQVQIRNRANNDYALLIASNVGVASSKVFKKNIKPANSKLDVVKNTKVYNYELKKSPKTIEIDEEEFNPRSIAYAKKNPVRKNTISKVSQPNTPTTHTGFITEESPKEMITSLGDGTTGISLYDTIGILWKAVQELSEEVDRLKEEKEKNEI